MANDDCHRCAQLERELADARENNRSLWARLAGLRLWVRRHVSPAHDAEDRALDEALDDEHDR